MIHRRVNQLILHKNSFFLLKYPLQMFAASWQLLKKGRGLISVLDRESGLFVACRDPNPRQFVLDGDYLMPETVRPPRFQLLIFFNSHWIQNAPALIFKLLASIWNFFEEAHNPI